MSVEEAKNITKWYLLSTMIPFILFSLHRSCHCILDLFSAIFLVAVNDSALKFLEQRKKNPLTECICYLIGLNAQIEWKTINFRSTVEWEQKKSRCMENVCVFRCYFSVIGISKWKEKKKLKLLLWLLLIVECNAVNLNAKCVEKEASAWNGY